MCGIIGLIGKSQVSPRLLEGLRRLEYRGYDSAGIATLVDQRIERRRCSGKLRNLADLLEAQPLPGCVGIGHTRWASHGAVNETNAHPHADSRVVLVHNGIIENFHELRQRLSAAGHRFMTETDSEAVVHLVSSHLDSGMSPSEAVQTALKEIEGAFALAILFAVEEDLMIVARRGSPLAIGYGSGEMYVASDALALEPLTRNVCYLEEGDWAEIRTDGAVIRDQDGTVVEREIRKISTTVDHADKGNYPHYMLKEIFEQPAVIGDVLQKLVNPWSGAVSHPGLPLDTARVPRISIVACGTSYHAGMVARYWFEKIARIPTDIEIASEFRYRDCDMEPGGLALFISQSGETADTLAALRLARQRNQQIVSVVNVEESSMSRESDAVLLTRAGREIGVASTKAFIAQLTTLAGLVVGMAAARGRLDGDQVAALGRALLELPSRVNQILAQSAAVNELARGIVNARDALFLGRGTSFPIALEGALKLKEISYIHAEGYAAGEMKHGPIALIDERMPVIVIAPSDELFDKTASNTHESIARGARVLLLSDAAGIARFEGTTIASFEMPRVDPFVAPILYTIPVQLLAYHAAVIKGTDVDQPRNLAKTVTVE